VPQLTFEYLAKYQHAQFVLYATALLRQSLDGHHSFCSLQRLLKHCLSKGGYLNQEAVEFLKANEA